MQIFISNVFLLGKRLLLVLGLYLFCRVYFCILNPSVFSPFEMYNVTLVFLNGLKFDTSSILFTNAPFILLHLFPFSFTTSSKYQYAIKVLMVVVNAFFLSLNIIDTGYFTFQNSRSSADFVTNILFSTDTVPILPKYLFDYWFHTAATFFIFALLWIVFPKYRTVTFEKKLSPFLTGLNMSLIAIAVILLSIIGFRGIAAKPLRIVDAAVNTSARYAPYVLNSTFTVLKTFGKASVIPERYFSEKDAQLIYSALKKGKQIHTSSKTSKNIVIIIMESMSNEVVGELNGDAPTYTPFLDSLIRSSLVFENMFSNGRTSIQAVPSIVVSLPQLLDVSLITSQYAANNVNSIASILGDAGYTTNFFHGAFNGSMGFDKYCSAIGIQNYYGQDEFMAQNSEQNAICSWGIFDDSFLPFTVDIMNSTKEPFFSTIFTISAHHPYELPSQYSYFAKNLSPDLAAVRYADYSLQIFFEQVKKTSWYNNTIFLLVADHTAPYNLQNKESGKQDNNTAKNNVFDLAKMQIPLIIFDPSNDSLRNRSKRIVQHLDILPSLLHLLKLEVSNISFGNDIFDPNSPQFAFSYNQGVYTYIDSIHIIQFDGVQLLQAIDRRNNSIVGKDSIEDKLRFMKAYIQEYSNRLVFNQLKPSDSSDN